MMPECGIEWVTSRQPIVLDYWPVCNQNNNHFTSIATWRGMFEPIDYLGKTYGLRVHEFRKFAMLPKLTDATFRVALDIDPCEHDDINMLDGNYWHREDPKKVVSTPDSYQRFIQDSKAEFSVAKNIYVETKGGWFSDRSICYLASGKPVLVQNTGLNDLYPIGEGLLSFSTLEQAQKGIQSILENYEQHCKAARKVAEDHFDSDKVLNDILDKLEIN